MYRVLIIKHGALGDVIQSMGACQDIRLHHPDAELVVLTTPPYRSIFSRCPYVDRVLTEKRPKPWQMGQWWQLIRRLRGESFDRVYDLQNTARTALYRRRILPDASWVTTIDKVSEESVLTAWQRAMMSAGLATPNILEPKVKWLADDIQWLVDSVGLKDDYIVMIPGSSASHPEKRWPYYEELAIALIERTKYHVVTVPGPDEVDLCRDLPATAMFRADGTVLDWFELAGVLARAAFVVGNDTGPTHIAANLGRPGLALFGGHKSPASTGIERRDFRVLAAPDLSRLGVEMVYDAIVSQTRGD
jgi:ADP-heptose:LPS heptosyltransferase